MIHRRNSFLIQKNRKSGILVNGRQQTAMCKTLYVQIEHSMLDSSLECVKLHGYR